MMTSLVTTFTGPFWTTMTSPWGKPVLIVASSTPWKKSWAMEPKFQFLAETENVLLVIPPWSWVTKARNTKSVSSTTVLTKRAAEELAESHGAHLDGPTPHHEAMWFQFETAEDAVMFRMKFTL